MDDGATFRSAISATLRRKPVIIHVDTDVDVPGAAGILAAISAIPPARDLVTMSAHKGGIGDAMRGSNTNFTGAAS